MDSFSKGGPGSGVKGHRTYKEDFKRFKDFFGTPRNYETFKSQGGLELLDKMFEIFGENITKDVLAKTTLSFDDKRTHSDAAGEVCFSSTGEASLRLRDETALFGITYKQKKYIAAHEIGHIAFTNFQLRDSSPLNDSLSEGLAILFSNSIMSSGWENNEYKKHAIQTFNLLKDFSEQEGETIQRSFKSISNLFIDESKIDKNIDKFLKFANKAKIKPLGNISKEFKDVIKEFRSGETNTGMEKGGPGSGIKGHRTEKKGKEKLFARGIDIKNMEPTKEERLGIHIGETNLGCCYDKAGEYLYYHPEVKGTLVHGTANLIKDLPLKFGHSWVELPDGKVFDGSANEFFNKKDYYKKLMIVEEKRYNEKEMYEQISENETWGPWHLTEGITK